MQGLLVPISLAAYDPRVLGYSVESAPFGRRILSRASLPQANRLNETEEAAIESFRRINAKTHLFFFKRCLSNVRGPRKMTHSGQGQIKGKQLNNR